LLILYSYMILCSLIFLGVFFLQLRKNSYIHGGLILDTVAPEEIASPLKIIISTLLSYFQHNFTSWWHPIHELNYFYLTAHFFHHFLHYWTKFQLKIHLKCACIHFPLLYLCLSCSLWKKQSLLTKLLDLSMSSP
jgi:hypothetical protein